MLMSWFYLRICWQKCSLCSGVRWELGKPGGRRASLRHTDSMLGQLRLTENKTSAKCSARQRGDWPPMACVHSETGPYMLNIYLVFFGYIFLYEVNVPKTLPIILHSTKFQLKYCTEIHKWFIRKWTEFLYFRLASYILDMFALPMKLLGIKTILISGLRETIVVLHSFIHQCFCCK